MTAKELIMLLQTLPPEIEVVVLGYEDGYNDILLVGICNPDL